MIRQQYRRKEWRLYWLKRNKVVQLKYGGTPSFLCGAIQSVKRSVQILLTRCCKTTRSGATWKCCWPGGYLAKNTLLMSSFRIKFVWHVLKWLQYCHASSVETSSPTTPTQQLKWYISLINPTSRMKVLTQSSCEVLLDDVVNCHLFKLKSQCIVVNECSPFLTFNQLNGQVY